MENCPPQHLGVVAIEKGAFGSLSTKVAKKKIRSKSESGKNSKCNKHNMIVTVLGYLVRVDFHTLAI